MTRTAPAAQKGVTAAVPQGLELSLWAPEQLLIDPVAIDIEPDGTLYVTSTTRNNMPLDIRQHQDWMATVHTLRTVRGSARSSTARSMAPASSDKNAWITDLNKDGSRDIRDLPEYKERIYRIRDTDGDGIADESRIVFEGFNDDPGMRHRSAASSCTRASLIVGVAARRLPSARHQRRRRARRNAPRSARATTPIRPSAVTASRA